MEEHTEDEGSHYGLEDGELVSEQVFKIEMPLKVLVHETVPFPCIFVEVGCIPEVLVELPISEAWDLSVEVGHEIKDHEEADVVRKHDWQIPTWENFESIHALKKESNKW